MRYFRVVDSEFQQQLKTNQTGRNAKLITNFQTDFEDIFWNPRGRCFNHAFDLKYS